jgi:hypothetical protein
MKLTEEQLNFLEKYGISASLVFDASGMSRPEYHDVMSKNKLLIAYGTTPCKAKQHTLRTRAGHCIQCDPSKMAFVKRYDEEGEIYVASSASLDIVKVGTSKDSQARIRLLNSQGYADIKDWQLKYYLFCKNAGRAEHFAHALLNEHKEYRNYIFEGNYKDCTEIFNCSVKDAVEAVKAAYRQSN